MDKLLRIVDSLEMNQLHRAVEENRLEGVKFLIKNNVDVTNTINEGYTSTHIAVSLNQECVVKELLKGKPREESRCLINRRTLDSDKVAIQMAAINNSLENTKVLLSYGANFEVCDNEYRTPKELTTYKNIQELLDNISEVFKMTLHNNSQEALFEKLSSYPAENLTAIMYARNCHGLTSLQSAMEQDNLEVVGEIIHFRIEKLKQNNWQPGTQIDKLMYHSKAARRYLSNLHDASYHRDGANLEKKTLVVDANFKKNVLHLLHNSYAFLESYKEQYDPSLNNQPLLVIIEESLQFFGALETSRFVDNKRFAKMLEKGAEFTIKMLKLCIIAPMQLFMQQVYSSELLLAAKNNDMGLVEKCLTGHPDLNKRDGINDWTALHYALDHSNNDMAKLLLNLGANPASSSERGQEKLTTLHIGLRRKMSPEVIKLIFENMNDEKLFDYVNARSDDNSTALHLAAKSHYFRLVEFLLSKGAFFRPKDASEKMPEDYCYSHNKLSELFDLAERLFRLACDGKAEELVQVMSKLDKSSFLAVAGARNEDGLTLEEILEIEGRCDDAEKIRGMFSSEHDYYKHADDFVLSKPKIHAHE